MATSGHRFERWLLPGLAFKAAVIGGGYATGRELAAFFMPSGPWGGLYAILLAMVIWSAVCSVTFLFALKTRSLDYRTFFQNLLGRWWWIYEVAYFLLLVVVLAVFAAAASAIGTALLGLPPIAGALILMACITLAAAWGNASVENVFKYVSIILYGTYATFVVLAFTRFGDAIASAFAAETPTTGWISGGVTYASYNIIGAIIILPVTRHLISRKDAVIAGVIAGPLAMIPALFFFICMAAFYPAIQDEALPSDFLLAQLQMPWFRAVFQLMIVMALLESGTGGVHAINERFAHAFRGRHGRALSRRERLAISVALLGVSIFLADRIGLVALIGNGYRWLAYVFLIIYVAPLMTFGIWKITRRPEAGAIA